MRVFTKLPLIIGAIVLTMCGALQYASTYLGPLLLFNFTDSTPRGIYRLTTPPRLSRGGYVALAPPRSAVNIASGRIWFRPDKLFIKQVAGIDGDVVCTKNHRVTINGADIGPLFDTDKQGKFLPHDEQCYVINPNSVFLLGPDSPWTFDSRYFGPVEISDISYSTSLIFRF